MFHPTLCFGHFVTFCFPAEADDKVDEEKLSRLSSFTEAVVERFSGERPMAMLPS